MAKLQVQQDQEKPVGKTVAVTALKKSGLNRRGIVVLTAQSSKQPQYVVQNVLDGLEQLRKDYCA